MEEINSNNELGLVINGLPIGIAFIVLTSYKKIAEGMISDANMAVELLPSQHQSL